jgi:ATP-dependent Clp protease ATP-binding subunit ClpX
MDEFRCSFCGRLRREVEKLISGPRVFICNECVDQCNQVLVDEDLGPEVTGTIDRLSARWRERVVGQEEARLPLIHLFLRHHTRTRLHLAWRWSSPAQVVLLTGPLGSGKTRLVETLATMFDLPLVQLDASRLRGETPSPERDAWAALLDAAGREEARARRAVVCVDRLDHLAASDAATVAAQELLLSWLNGGPVIAPGERGHERTVLRTDHMLFVATGVFRGLDGGSLDDDSLVRYGLLPEIVSRLGVRLSLRSLSQDELRELFERKGSGLVAACVAQFAERGQEVTFEPAAVEALVAEASRRLGGGHAAASLVEAVAREISLRLSDSGATSLVVTAEQVRAAVRL